MSATIVAAPDAPGGRPRGLAIALAAAFLWSLTGVMVRLIEAASTWQIVFYRSLFIALALGLYLAWRYRGGVVRAFRAIGWLGVLAGCLVGVGFTAYLTAITNTTIANASFLVTTTPLIAALLARVALGERVARRTWIVMVVALAGVAIMVVEGFALGGWIGNLAALAAAACQAAYTVALRRGRAVDMTPALCWGSVVATFLGALFVESFAISTYDAGVCLMVALVSTALGNVLFVVATRYIGAAELSLLCLSEVVMSPLWVWFAFAERPTEWALLGGLVVLGAVLLHVAGQVRGAAR